MHLVFHWEIFIAAAAIHKPAYSSIIASESGGLELLATPFLSSYILFIFLH